MKQILLLPFFAFLACISDDLSAHERASGAAMLAQITDAEPLPYARLRLCETGADCVLESGLPRRDENVPIPSEYLAPPDIADAIRRASNFTGVDFEYLLRVAALESSYVESTEAKTSTAVGLFQFIEPTWILMVDEMRHEFAMDEFADAIVTAENGERDVPDPTMREKILNLRRDPELSAVLAGEFARRNQEYVSRELGRELAAGELYVAHFLGPNAGIRLIRLTETDPQSHANRHFPQAARANRPIFFREKEPRTVAEVYGLLIGKYRNVPICAEGATQAAEVSAGD